MFLGHTLHESDEWKASREYLICADTKEVGGEVYCKPCTGDEFDWDNFMCDGVGLAGGGLTFNGYCNSVIEPPLACPCEDTLVSEPAPLEGYLPASKIYFGRGAVSETSDCRACSPSSYTTTNQVPIFLHVLTHVL